jgi:hypothetical protein
MARDIGEDIPVAPQTMEGRDWPCLRQFCIFIENRVGCLHELLKQLERVDLRVVALSIVDSVDFAVARLVVDHTDLAREVLTLNGFTLIENDIIGVELPDDPQPYMRVLTALLRGEINIDYTYPLLYEREGRKAVAIKVENVDSALPLLRGQGLRVLTEADLKDTLDG